MRVPTPPAGVEHATAAGRLREAAASAIDGCAFVKAQCHGLKQGQFDYTVLIDEIQISTASQTALAEMFRACESELQKSIAWKEASGFTELQFGVTVGARRTTETSDDVSLLGVIMKAEIVHEVALRAARFCRQIERRSFETQETPDSAQGVEVIYVEIVQQYLATELRLPQNIKQKRKPVKIQVVVTGITGKGYGVPGAVHGVRDVVADRRRTEIVQRCVETQSHLPQHPEEKRTLEMRSAAASGAASLAQADAETAELERRRTV